VTKPVWPWPWLSSGSADASLQKKRLKIKAELKTVFDYLKANYKNKLKNKNNINLFKNNIDNNTKQLKYDLDSNINLFKDKHVSYLDNKVNQS
jgi:hypothetical protein